MGGCVLALPRERIVASPAEFARKLPRNPARAGRPSTESFSALGDESRAEAVLRQVSPVTLETLVSDFLRDYRDGALPGRKPSDGTVGVCINHLLGERGGFIRFARTQGRTLTTQFDVVLVTRWLETESRRLSNDSLRMKLIVARHVARYAHARGLIRSDVLQGVLTLRPAPSARGRAQVDGVPSMTEVERVLAALRERRGDSASRMQWDTVAELQLRLGLRRSEVIALDETWLDPARGCVVVRVSADFDTKSHASRTVDGVDAVTFDLARSVIAMKRRFGATPSGYKEAWKRACARLEKPTRSRPESIRRTIRWNAHTAFIAPKPSPFAKPACAVRGNFK